MFARCCDHEDPRHRRSNAVRGSAPCIGTRCGSGLQPSSRSTSPFLASAQTLSLGRTPSLPVSGGVCGQTLPAAHGERLLGSCQLWGEAKLEAATSRMGARPLGDRLGISRATPRLLGAERCGQPTLMRSHAILIGHGKATRLGVSVLSARAGIVDAGELWAERHWQRNPWTNR